MRIWEVPLAGGPLLQLPTAQVDQGNYSNSNLQNFSNDRPPRSVLQRPLILSVPCKMQLTRYVANLLLMHGIFLITHCEGDSSSKENHVTVFQAPTSLYGTHILHTNNIIPDVSFLYTHYYEQYCYCCISSPQRIHLPIIFQSRRISGRRMK